MVMCCVLMFSCFNVLCFKKELVTFIQRSPSLKIALQFSKTGLKQPMWYPPVHFLRAESYLTPGRVSLHLKSSSQNSANQMFLLLFSRDLEIKYWSKPETMKIIEREFCRFNSRARVGYPAQVYLYLHHNYQDKKICTLMFLRT